MKLVEHFLDYYADNNVLIFASSKYQDGLEGYVKTDNGYIQTVLENSLHSLLMGRLDFVNLLDININYAVIADKLKEYKDGKM
jgi:hypothetical protein